jgi:hypothetical protein
MNENNDKKTFFDLVDELMSSFDANNIKSKIMANLIFDYIYSHIYANVILNVFINLGEFASDNNSEDKIILEVRKKYQHTEKEIRIALGFFKNNKFNKEFYTKFKFDFKKNFPSIKSFEVLEAEIQLQELEEYIKNKKIKIINKLDRL